MTHNSLVDRRPLPVRRYSFALAGLYLPVAIALILRLASEQAAGFSFLILAIFALCGRGHAILALACSWFFTMINPEIAASSDGASIGRYLVILAASATAVWNSRLFNRNNKPGGFFLAVTSVMGGCIIIHSIIFSEIPSVSLLKSVSWTLSMVSLVSLWQGIGSDEYDSLSNRIYCGLVLILIVSIPFLVLPAGFARNGTGFQGVLNHPQVFGGTMALLGAWSCARMFVQRVPSWATVGLAGSSIVLVLLSEARTAGAALVLGLLLSLLLAPAFAGISIFRIAPGLRSARIWALIGAAILAALAMASAFAEAIGHFLSKSGRAGSSNLLEAYDASRGFLIDPMLVNIANHPFVGIGFGVASIPSVMEIQRDPILGLPIGASVEKGVAPLAIIEELGIPLAILVGLWILGLLRKGAVGGLAAFSVCLTALLLNLGENTLFSPGGQGMLVLVLLGWVSASGQRVGPNG